MEHKGRGMKGQSNSGALKLGQLLRQHHSAFSGSYLCGCRCQAQVGSAAAQAPAGAVNTGNRGFPTAPCWDFGGGKHHPGSADTKNHGNMYQVTFCGSILIFFVCF